VACQLGARVVFGVGGADGSVGDAVTCGVGLATIFGDDVGDSSARSDALASRFGVTDDDGAAQALSANRRPAPASVAVARRNDVVESRLRGQCRLDFMVGWRAS
jgi:hypothetical protein